MARRGVNVKSFSKAKEILFERKGKIVTNIQTKEKKTYPSINLAKKFTKAEVDKNGLGSVVTIK